MDEFSIAENIIEIVKDSIQKSDLEKVSYINIKIGKMSNILPEALKSAFNILKENTELKQTALLIEISPMIVKCNECGHTSVINDFILNCMNCSSSNLTVSKGDELEVSEITLY